MCASRFKAWGNRPMPIQGSPKAMYQLRLAGGPDANN